MARVLIVDDDADLASVLTYFLRKAGHTPLPAPTGHAALLAARAYPDVIFLDLGLPDIAGEEVLRRLKCDPHTAQIPVVVVSGEPDAADRVPRDGHIGAVAVLQKPVSGSDLCAVADFVLEDRKYGIGNAQPAALTGNPPFDHGQREIIYRLLSTGSHSLVRQVFRRLGADRKLRHGPAAAEAPSWRDLARAGRQEGLLNDGEGTLLAAGPAGVAAPH
jgi:DNA-binding response OmpR family regulator